jgi:ethanolamine utilization protein EutA
VNGVPANRIRHDHDHDDDHDHGSAGLAASPNASLGCGAADIDPDTLRLTTVGIDVGSSTSHMMLAEITLQRLATNLSSRFVVVGRRVVWRSEIILTPYLPDGPIDAESLAAFVADGYRQAGIPASRVDSGAVILTGEALRRRNARAIADALSTSAGTLVCAAAGHHLEAALAAHGSGAVALSKKQDRLLLHLDIGGGTTKLALVGGGAVLATAAVAVGGRLVAYDGQRRITRLEDTLSPVLEQVGIHPRLGDTLSQDEELLVCEVLAGVVLSAVRQRWEDPLVRALTLTDPLVPAGGHRPAGEVDLACLDAVSVSGGVAEYLAGSQHSFGDIARSLAEAIARNLRLAGIRFETAEQLIRATVIGASQYTVQVSGSTVSIDDRMLPVRNLPVAAFAIELDEDGHLDSRRVARRLGTALKRLDEGSGELQAAAVSLRWVGDPSYRNLSEVARGIVAAWAGSGRGGRPLLAIVDRDVAVSLAGVLRQTPGAPDSVCVLDGIELGDFDFVDIGAVAQPAGVVPVLVRSLVFPA